jgi:hypothetical protein
MGDENVRIANFRLRVPGMSAEEGRFFGEDVVRRAAEALPQQIKSSHLGALNLRVNISASTPRDQIARMVAKMILRGLK